MAGLNPTEVESMQLIRKVRESGVTILSSNT